MCSYVCRKDYLTHVGLQAKSQRWLKILWKMWQTKTCYNGEFHMANQLKHGSWVLAAKPKEAQSTTT
jgi:hypothetical protein